MGTGLAPRNSGNHVCDSQVLLFAASPFMLSHFRCECIKRGAFWQLDYRQFYVFLVRAVSADQIVNSRFMLIPTIDRNPFVDTLHALNSVY